MCSLTPANVTDNAFGRICLSLYVYGTLRALTLENLELESSFWAYRYSIGTPSKYVGRCAVREWST